MELNVGKTDRKARILLGILIILTGIVFQSWWGLAGVVLVVTAMISWCPIYALLGINTCVSKTNKKYGN